MKAIAKKIDAYNRIFDLENSMLEMEQLEIETFHHFAPGVYAREVRIPADTCVTGKVHRTEHLNICAVGYLTVVNGDERREIRGPCVFTSPPGTKRAAVVHEDTVWITIHATEETNVEKLEGVLVHNDPEELKLMLENTKLKEIE